MSSATRMPLFARAVLAFVALPGVIAFLVPVVWLVQSGHTAIVQPLGLLPLLLGIAGLLWCVRDFYVAGRGTLAPWSPPVHLVEVGLYRVTRNPMYVSVTTLLIGWAWAFGERGLFTYAVLVWLAFHLRVLLHEEPFLARTHGERWTQYKERVPRWLWRGRR